ncbi:MAG: ribosomal subunit interface protein [Gemmatimonadota bacterium]
MQILINTGQHIQSGANLTREIQGAVGAALQRFGDRITRVELYLKDERGPGERDDDVCCLIEARAAGFRPVAVRHQAATVGQALHGAVTKLERLLQGIFARRRRAVDAYGH